MKLDRRNRGDPLDVTLQRFDTPPYASSAPRSMITRSKYDIIVAANNSAISIVTTSDRLGKPK